MPQTQKTQVRESLVAAAASLFAEVGFEAATMAAVAERAGSSIGNVYKYFANKDELFTAVLPEDFATELRRRTRARIKAIGDARDIRLLAPESRYHVLAGELLDYCIANRERVVILLGRAEGTPFASFAEDFVQQLVAWAFEYARDAWPEIRPSPTMRFAIRRIYSAFVRSMADALMTFRGEAQVRDAVSYLTAHHQGGMKHLFESAAAQGRTR